MLRRSLSLLALSGTVLGGCVSGAAPDNLASAQWAPTQRLTAHTGADRHHREGDWLGAAATGVIASDCSGLATERPLGQQVSLGELGPAEHILAAGDRLHIELLGDPDGLSGLYTIDSNGTISLGTVRPIDAIGMGPAEFERALHTALVSAGLLRPLRNAVRVRLAETSGVPVHVAGAVFDSGLTRPGERSAESRVGQKEGEVSGDANPARTVSAAIRAAGGVRPDADISSIYLIRGDRFATVDLRGLVAGFAATDPLVTAGDRVLVPDAPCFNPDLVRPSSLTQPGLRVFMSNLSRGANSNSGAGIGEKTGSLPYGTRLLQALVTMNCVGGSYMQANRRAILVSRNPKNGESIVIERDVEKLVRTANRDDVDPFLMPGDSIICYDSRWSNFREALSLVGDVTGTITPGIIAQKALD